MKAKHRGFTDLPAARLRQAGEELAFIVSCDTKYQVGGAEAVESED